MIHAILLTPYTISIEAGEYEIGQSSVEAQITLPTYKEDSVKNQLELNEIREDSELFVQPPKAPIKPKESQETASPCEDISPLVRKYAEQYEVIHAELMATIKGESNCRMVYGDHGNAFGIGQFWRGTFNRFSKEMNLENADYYNLEDQLQVMAWAFSQGESYKSHWAVWRKLFSTNDLVKK